MDKLNKKVLIVEDEISLIHVLDEKFAAEGFDVLRARDGEEGLASAISNQPDIILLDIVMPKMDGITMLKKLREDDWGKAAKVILLTNLTSSDAIEEAAKHNVFDYLVKTEWKLESVVLRVKKMLDL